MKGSPLQRNFNIGAKSPLEQVVTQASEDVENNTESVDSWHEEKKKLGNMSARDRRRAVKELRNELRVGNQPKQKTYWDETTKTKKKIPGLFSSKAAKEDFILKQTMKKRGPVQGDAMSHDQMQEYIDAGIDPTTMKPTVRRSEMEGNE